MISAAVVAGILWSIPTAPGCSAEQLRELTRRTDTPHILTCSPTLDATTTVTRPLVVEGSSANGLTIDCKGGTLGHIERAVTTASPTLFIRSRKRSDGRWDRPEGVVVRECRIIGNVRIWGMGSDGHYDDLRASSRMAGHTARLQAAAPSGILLDRISVEGRGSIPLYIGPGTTGVTLRASTLRGTSTASAIYLDAESARNVIADNIILTRTGREMISVDGSAANTLTRNRFDLHGGPGILLYRNCGERGVIRHQTPSDNLITGNRFTGASWLRPRLVVENARNGRRSYCRDDAGYPFGSSIDDRDNASGNTITDNRRN